MLIFFWILTHVTPLTLFSSALRPLFLVPLVSQGPLPQQSWLLADDKTAAEDDTGQTLFQQHSTLPVYDTAGCSCCSSIQLNKSKEFDILGNMLINHLTRSEEVNMLSCQRMEQRSHYLIIVYGPWIGKWQYNPNCIPITNSIFKCTICNICH